MRVIRRGNSKKVKQYNDQTKKDKYSSTKHCTENSTLSKSKSIENGSDLRCSCGTIQWTSKKWQTIIYKHYTNNRATPTPLKIKGELMCSWSVSSSCSTCETRRVTVKRHEHHLTWKSCWTSVYINTNSINKTWIPAKTNGSREEWNIIFSAKHAAL
jgi:hypothetical protein